MRSQIVRLREKARRDDIQRGGVVLMGDRSRRRLFDELASLSQYSDELNYDDYGGRMFVCGVEVEPQ